MKMTLLASVVCLLAAPLSAGEVTVAKSHICCPGCVKAIEKTMGKVDGVENLVVNQDEKSVAFNVADAAAAKKALRALARAGFSGEAKHDGKAVKLPIPKALKDKKANEVTLNRVHLCCGACVKAVEGAVSKVKGVKSVKCDKEKGTCTAAGEEIEVIAVIQALRDAGFNGSVPRDDADKPKKNKKKAA